MLTIFSLFFLGIFLYLICYATKFCKLNVTIREIKFLTSFEFIQAYICSLVAKNENEIKLISYKFMLLFYGLILHIASLSNLLLVNLLIQYMAYWVYEIGNATN